MAPRSSRETSQRRDQRRRTHRYTDSNTELIDPDRGIHSASPSPSPTKSRPKRAPRHRNHQTESETSKSTSNALSAGSLAQLDAVNHGLGWSGYDGVRPRDRERRALNDDEEELVRRQERRERRERRRRERGDDLDDHDREDERRARRVHRRERQASHTRVEEPRTTRRVISGTYLERGTQRHSDRDRDARKHQQYLSEKEAYEHQQHLAQRGGTASSLSDEEYEFRRKRRKRWICMSICPLADRVKADLQFRGRRCRHPHHSGHCNTGRNCRLQQIIFIIFQSRQRWFKCN